MKIENWNGNSIRFVEHDGEWWAVAQDVCNALGLKNTSWALKPLKGVVKCDITISDTTWSVETTTSKARHTQEMLIINEKDIYRLVFKSRKPEAEAFQDWVYGMLKMLREQTGLEGFEVFRMLDKEHQKEAMQRLLKGIKETRQPTRVDFIKANTIANKAVSNRYGFPKMVKKGDMTPKMLAERQEVLDDTVNLMSLNERYNMGLSVSKKIYGS